MIILIVTAGNISLYGYDDIPVNASDAKEPKLASGLLTPIPKKLWSKLESKKTFRAAVCILLPLVLLSCTAYLVDSSYNPFLYFRF